ncbi:DUF5959 family protein [Streptomyces sp. Tu 3180]|uniref:DUF5959 family protein n=1 Tax=Streptomyces sp. Tu 3180 TaxID=2682611 RepID=UPI00135BCED8|nr:DUF5959 family protein [Streptomyces sp. Tu 3180]KAF3466126.1 hypothetical protein GL259_18500 [Streptomyces sp. Tu 3180]
MDSTDGVIDLIHLADGQGTGGHGVAVRVLGRSQPGVLFGHDFLECEIVVAAEPLDAVFPVTLLPEDLEDWEDTLAALESGRSALWLDSGRTPSLTLEPDGHGRMSVSVHDGPASGVTVTVPLSALPTGWADEQRALLARVRDAYHQEVAETSPGTYVWRRTVDT